MASTPTETNSIAQHNVSRGARRRHRLVGLLLAVFAVALLLVTAPQMGLTWDEPAYIAASESYAAWFGALLARPGFALSSEGIQYYWEPNHEHPPLDKVWSGLVWSLARFAFDDLTAHRLGNMMLVGVLVALLYLMLALEAGYTAGLAAVAALITMPRFFFHAHLAALDVPAAVVVFAVTYLFWRTRDRPTFMWDVWLGLAWGLALATKINAIFVPVTLGLWVLAFRRRWFMLRRLVMIGVLGVPVFLASWPWLYRGFFDRIVQYILFVTVDHWKIGQWYLGRFYMPPPWHFAFLMTVAAVPASLSVLGAVGVARGFRDSKSRALLGMLALGTLIPLLALSSGQSMVYDNERLFMPCFPCLAGLAGLGFQQVLEALARMARRMTRVAWRRMLPLAVTAVVFVPQVVIAGTLYPHLLSYYSAVVGGLPGATRLGLETTYWCETYAQSLSYLNAHAQPRDTVWVQGWSHDVMIYYQLHGQLNPDLKIAWPQEASTVFSRENMRGYSVPWSEADFVVLQYRQTGFDHDMVRWLREREPAYRLSRYGIPLMDIFSQ